MLLVTTWFLCLGWYPFVADVVPPTVPRSVESQKSTSRPTPPTVPTKTAPISPRPAAVPGVPQQTPTPAAAPGLAKPVHVSIPTTQKAVPSAGKSSQPVQVPPTTQPPTQVPDILDRLPYQPDLDVKVYSLPNGLLSWCKSRPSWEVVEIRMAIAAGTVHDPKGLYGRSRFLSYLLHHRLNQPQNPAQSLLPPGGQRYHTMLGKDWVELQIKTTTQALPAVLQHIGKSLVDFMQSPTDKLQRDALSKGAGSFPPPSITEQIEAYMFGGQPRGALLRGRKKTFQTIQPFALRSAHEKLYTAKRMRLLVVGSADCQSLPALLQKTLGALPNGKDEDLYVKSLVNNTGNAQNLLNSQDVFLLYQLPSLHRRSYIPLVVLQDIVKKEIHHQTVQQWGQSVRVSSQLQPLAHNGYLTVHIPSSPLERVQTQKMLKQTLGRLQMKQYLPALEQRIKLYLGEVRVQMQQLQESSVGTVRMLWPQMLLPSQHNQKETQAPTQIIPTLEGLNSTNIRELALNFLLQDIPLFRNLQPFSMQRVALFIGTIILIWLLLDMILRRSRRPEE